jgi:putative peptidoglycan lipid II flippase
VGRSDFYGAATTLLVLSLALKVLGIVQQALLAYLFGATSELDAFLVAVSVPMLAVNILASGSLSLAFVPLFSEYYTRGEQDKAWFAASVLANLSVGVALAILVAGALIAPAIARWLGPGFDVPTHRLTTALFIILLPTVALATLSAMVKSVLYFFRRFGAANSAYVVGSLVLLGTVVLLQRHIGVRAVAWGMVLSASVALGMQLVVLRGAKPRYHLSFDVRRVGVKQTGVLLLGMTLSIVALQLNLIVDRAFASQVGEGAVSILEYAADFDKLIVSTFALSAAAAIYPTLSDLFSWARVQEFADSLSATILTVALAVLPLAIVALVLRHEIIGVVLQRGRFGATETEAVAGVLVCLMPALVAWAFLYTALNAFFARRESFVPVAVMLGVLAGNIALDAWLGHGLGVRGLALATSITAWAGCTLLWALLFRRVPAIDLRRLAVELSKIAVGTGLAGTACWLVARGTQAALAGAGFGSQVATLALSAGSAGVVYMLAMWLLRVDEARRVSRWAVHRLWQPFSRT